MRGLYLVEPHGRLIYQGDKKSIAKSRPLPLDGEWIIMSKENGVGLAYGHVKMGTMEEVSSSDFDARFKEHRVTTRERAKWWPNADILHLWPIEAFEPYDKPRMVKVRPGVQTVIPEVEFIEQQPVGRRPDQDRERTYTEEGAPRTSDVTDDPQHGGEKEVAMPYTVSDPPRPARNWTTGQKKKCVGAANAVLREGGKEQDAIFACIRAAGKTVHPGGKKSIEPDDFVIARELVDQFMACASTIKAEWTTAYKNSLPDSHFLWVKPGGKKDEEGKTVPRDNRMLPYKDKEGNVDLFHVRNALSRLGQEETEVPGDVRQRLTKKAQRILAQHGKKELDAILEQENLSQRGGEELGILVAALVEALQAAGEKQATQACVCPECGHEEKTDTACSKVGCPKCGAKMREAEETQDGSGEERGSEEEPEAQEEKEVRQEPESPGFNEKVMDWLDNFQAGLVERLVHGISEHIVSRFSKSSKSDTVSSLPIQTACKTYETPSGETWFELWVTNAYQDRENEFFRKKAIHDFVDRHENDDVKGTFQYRHIPGSDFGTVKWQAVVADRFLVQLGPFDDTPVGQAFKTFFTKYPESHPTIAPEGWGASHGYNYIPQDQLDGEYDWFETKESSVLPRNVASNPHNPRLEVLAVNEKQMADLEAISEVVGVPELPQMIIEAGESARKKLDGRVQHKSIDAEEESTTDANTDDTAVGNADDVKALASQVVETLQLGELSKVIETQTTALTSMANQVKSIGERLDALERSDQEKLAEKLANLPHLSKFQASRAAATVLGDSEEDNGLKSAAQSSVPLVVQQLAGRIGTSR